MHSIYTGSATGDYTAEKLNRLVETEMKIVELYIRALKTLDNSPHRNQFVLAMHCHQGRADLLAGEVRRLGAQPHLVSGEWLPFTVNSETNTETIENTIISLLTDAENNGSLEYGTAMQANDFAVQKLAQQLFAKQQSTEHAAHELQSRLMASAA